MAKILVINTKDTSTKLGYFEDNKKIWVTVISHNIKEIRRYKTFDKQKNFRTKEILKTLNKKRICLDSIDAYAAGGGVAIPLKSGTYEVDKKICSIYSNQKEFDSSDFSCPIMFDIANKYNKKVYFTDAPSTDEVNKIAKLTGVKGIKRKCRFHALNQKAVARLHCEKFEMNYENVNLIVIHLGNRITIGAHCNGKVIDVNDMKEEGPIMPQRSGTLPLWQLIELSYNKNKKYMKKLIDNNSGLMSLLYDKNIRKIMLNYSNDAYVKNTINSMIYHIACEVGKRSVSLYGKVDGVIITGPFANNKIITTGITKYISFLSKVFIYPGEYEMETLASGAYNAYKKKIDIQKIDYNNID